MKIHFSNVNFSSSSGPNTFGSRLANELTKKGHHVVNHNEHYDIFLCFIEPTSKPRTGSKFIHRLDGIWFKPDEYHTHNKLIKWSYENADHVIWQSNFDKQMTLKHWGSPKRGTIIHNGIKLNKFDQLHPDIERIKNSFDKIFVCSASWHRQKRLKENVLFYKSVKKEKDALLVLGENPDYIEKGENIFYLGHLPHDLCLQIYSIADWFLHLAWLDHCPNVVIEAMSQGCPVVCTDMGGTKEIVKNNGLIIKENNPYNFELTDYDNPYEIDINNISLPNIIVKKDHLDIQLVCNQYEEVFKWD